MQKEYKFIWNKPDDYLLISSSKDGKLSKMSGTTAQLLLEVKEKNLFNLKEVVKKFPKFFESAIQANWFTSSGDLNGKFIIVSRPNHLKRLQIELSTRCNFQCSYCYSESGPHENNSLDPDKVCKVISEADELGLASLDLTGGEFFLYKGWKEVFKHARELGIATTIHTNGYFLNKENVEYIKHYGVQQIQVTMESHLREIHEEVGRGQRGAFDKVIKGIKLAKDNDLQIRISIMVHQRNIETIGESVAWFNKYLGVPVLLDRVIDNGVIGAKKLSVTEADFWQAISPLLKYGNKKYRVCDYEGRYEAALKDIEPDCGVAHSFIYLTADGYYSLCPTMTHREEIRFAGPHIDSCSLSDAWHHSQLFNKYRKLNCENLIDVQQQQNVGVDAGQTHI